MSKKIKYLVAPNPLDKNLTKEINGFDENFKKTKTKVISFKKSNIEFSDESKYIASINKVNAKYKYKKDYDKFTLNGIFLGDNININFESDLNSEKNLLIKLKELNLLTKISFIKPNKEENIINGKILFKKDKRKIESLFCSIFLIYEEFSIFSRFVFILLYNQYGILLIPIDQRLKLLQKP